jgi:hypothetical protein
LLDPLELSKCLPRIGAFVVAVLEDERARRWAANMVERLSSGSTVGVISRTFSLPEMYVQQECTKAPIVGEVDVGNCGV